MISNINILFSDRTLLIVCFLNILINLLTLTTNAARVSGAVTKRVATALSLFNIFQVSFRLLNMVYAPLMASIVDKESGSPELVLVKLRFIVLAAALGSFLGFLMLPTFIEIYKNGIKAMEKHGSVPSVAMAFLTRTSYWKTLFHSLRKPSFLEVSPFQIEGIPKAFLIFNMLGIAIWTIGVISSTYASVLNPDMVRTSIHLSGLVNGIGTIFLFVLVEPVSALIVDQAAAESRPVSDVQKMVIWLAFGSIAGNILGLLLMEPAALYINWMSSFISRFF